MSAVEEVSECFFREIVEEQMKQYRESLNTSDPSKCIEVYAEAIKVFRTLSEEQQGALLRFFKVIATDTASIIFGGLSGSSDIYGLDGEFFLSYKGEDVTSEIQEAFLWKIEESGLLGQ